MHAIAAVTVSIGLNTNMAQCHDSSCNGAGNNVDSAAWGEFRQAGEGRSSLIPHLAGSTAELI